MSKNYIFSSESVGEGHPDKVCDTISDAVLDACLAEDPTSRVACETYAKSNLVVVGGEITTKAKLDFNAIARQAIRLLAARATFHLCNSRKQFEAGAVPKQGSRCVPPTLHAVMHPQIVEADRQLTGRYVANGSHCWAMWIGLTESRSAGGTDQAAGC